jgi:hypothetical protein
MLIRGRIRMMKTKMNPKMKGPVRSKRLAKNFFKMLSKPKLRIQSRKNLKIYKNK